VGAKGQMRWVVDRLLQVWVALPHKSTAAQGGGGKRAGEMGGR